MTEQTWRCDVKYQYGTYSGIVTVYVGENDDPIAAAWRQLRPHMSLPMAYQSAKVIRSELCPRLGYATTAELIRELAARAEVSAIAGETWPAYKTVSDP